jgi:hypothetical protein
MFGAVGTKGNHSLTSDALLCLRVNGEVAFKLESCRHVQPRELIDENVQASAVVSIFLVFLNFTTWFASIGGRLGYRRRPLLSMA